MHTPATPIPAAGRARFEATADSIGRAVGFAPALSSVPAGWNNVALFAWRGQCGEACFEPLDAPMLVYHTAGAQSVPVRIGPRWHDRSRPGLITLLPAGTPVVWDVRGEVHSFSVHLGSRFFAGTAADGRRAGDALAPRCGVRDPLLAASIGALARELQRPTERGSLYAEAVSDAMALHLLRDSALPPEVLPAGQRLARTVLRRSMELMEERLEEGVSLQAVADAVGLSRAYFAVAFRNSTGVSPHRYLTRRRIERAQALLLGSALSIAEIAVRCGFSSQSHFTECFRRALGTTPARLRDG